MGVRFAIYPSECVQYMKTEFYDMQNMVGGGGSDLQNMVGWGLDLQFILLKNICQNVRYEIDRKDNMARKTFIIV